MNEKYMQYYDLRNNKTLISQQTPTENEIYEFNLWKEQKIIHNKKNTPSVIGIFIFIILIIMLIRSFT